MSNFPFDSSESIQDLKAWLTLNDVEKRNLASGTWIPLKASRSAEYGGSYGHAGHRKQYHTIDCLIVPNDLAENYAEVDWHSVCVFNSHRAWCDEGRFIPAGCHDEDPLVRYPVIDISFDSGEINEWLLFQDIETSLRLRRSGDSWTLPEEDNVEVAVLERDENGYPDCFLIKAEFLRDYLCAKNSFLLITGFSFRMAIEEDSSKLEIVEGKREFPNGNWEGIKSAIHEGGRAYGAETAVIRSWRESVDPNDDVPIMPHPTEETESRSESYTMRDRGRKLWIADSKIWYTHRLQSGGKSPRVRGDHVPAKVHFIVENQEQKTLAGDELSEYRGWLWFKPSVIKNMLNRPRSRFEWYSQNTGDVGPCYNQSIHFGLNKLGLVNVLGYDLGRMPEWVQKLWAPYNVVPEGGLSIELHTSHNLGVAPETLAPEVGIWNNLNVLHSLIEDHYGIGLFGSIPEERDFFHRIHRFYGESFENVCALCKELHRAIGERIDIGALNSKIDPTQAQAANAAKLRQIKRLALWLTRMGGDGHALTTTLAGINELRQADAHHGGSSIRDNLHLLGIDKNSEDYQSMCWKILTRTSDAIAEIGRTIQANIETSR